MIYIILYLAAIVAANLSVVALGPNATIINAFLFIGLDLTARDKLHDKWNNDNLVIKMIGLILAGSLLSWLLNRNAGQIAIASFVAFLAAGLVDAIIYQLLSGKSKRLQINGSNIPAAMVDSLVFPFLAFGGSHPWIVLGQFTAKILGGLVWGEVLRMNTK